MRRRWFHRQGTEAIATGVLCAFLAASLSGCGVICSLAGSRGNESATQTWVAHQVTMTPAAVRSAATESPPAAATPTSAMTRPAPATATQQATSSPSPAIRKATAAPRPSRTPLPTATPAEMPSPVAPHSPDFPEATYVLVEERVIAGYAVRLWHNEAQDSPEYDGIVTISAAGQATVQINYATGLGELTGEDIIGEGHPAVVVQTYTGGAHCCTITYAYDLGPTLKLVLETPESNCGGEFQDLNGDGVYEFVTCDDSFAYEFCAYAGSPLVKVIMEYDPGQGYVPASPSWPEQYAEDTVRDTQTAEQGKPGDMGEMDDTTKCSVLPLVLDYLYSGDADSAWAALDAYYPYDDLDAFQAQIEEIANKSPLFVKP